MSLVQRSLCAGAVIALTALLRASCRGRLPRRMYIALWDLAALPWGSILWLTGAPKETLRTETTDGTGPLPKPGTASPESRSQRKSMTPTMRSTRPTV